MIVTHEEPPKHVHDRLYLILGTAVFTAFVVFGPRVFIWASLEVANRIATAVHSPY